MVNSTCWCVQKAGGRKDRIGEVSGEVCSEQSWQRWWTLAQSVLIEVEKQSGCVTGGAEKQLMDVTEKYKGVQGNVRVYAQVVGRLELHLGDIRGTRAGVVV